MDTAEKPENLLKKKKSGSETRHRAGIIGIRVSAQERAELEEAAGQAGLTLGSYVRERVLTAPKTRAVKRPPFEKKLLAQILGQLGKAGGNIHQIVKRMNYGEGIVHVELKEALASFEEAASAVMEAMGRGQR